MGSGSNIIAVHVTPKSGRDCLCKLEPDRYGNPLLYIKVQCAAEGGKANAQVCKLVAKSLKIAKSNVCIVSGAKSRFKRLSIKCSESKYTNWLKNIC